MIIEFGDWQLRPYDKLNWQLFRRVTVPDNAKTRGDGTAGKRRWRPYNRFSQQGGVPAALKIAAEYELRNNDREMHATLSEAADEYERILGTHSESILRCLEGSR